MLRQIRLSAERQIAADLSDALLAAGALSVCLEDAAADTEHERPLFDEPGPGNQPPQQLAWDHNALVVLLDAGADPAQLLASACAIVGIEPPLITADEAVEDADWVRLTQAQFAPIRIGARLWIVPSWHRPPDPPAVVVQLDPGVAFGTGTHPTTRLCLEWLDAELRPGASVLDYGCGSGILAIAAAKLGAGAVAGTDLDPQALAAARANSRINAVTARYTAPAALPVGTFDIVLANILTNPLKLLAPVLLERVAAGGALVLSGVLQRQADALLDAYRAVDAALPLSVWRTQEGWACIAGRRSS